MPRGMSSGRGSIPAGAGETPRNRPAARCWRVDPRGCGGDAGKGVAYVYIRGRSPRVRGRRDKPNICHAPVGSIPAGAGETPLEKMCDAVFRVDPRGCGGDRPGARRRGSR